MHITPATLEDARRVAEIHVTAWQSSYQGVVPPEYLASLSVEEREAMWRESIVKGVPQLFVAKVEGAMVGGFRPMSRCGSAPGLRRGLGDLCCPPLRGPAGLGAGSGAARERACSNRGSRPSAHG